MNVCASTLFDELAARLKPGTVVRRDEPLARRTTLRVGGPADLYAEPASERDLSELLRFARENDMPVKFLGRGSNLLVRDGGVRGLVICLCHEHFNRIEVSGKQLHCGAGARLKAVAMEARRQNLSGMEFLEGIPGSVGGALRMNAGAMGGWIHGIVDSMRFMDADGRIHEKRAGEYQANYRNCPALREAVALSAVLRGSSASRTEIEARMSEFARKRWSSQPKESSAGCAFKNPESIPAGKLVDELGLKGTRIGGAMIAHEHGNFIVNTGSATAADVLALIELIRERARERGIELETEVEIIGEN